MAITFGSGSKEHEVYAEASRKKMGFAAPSKYRPPGGSSQRYDLVVWRKKVGI
jgi:hypothetical protein